MRGAILAERSGPLIPLTADFRWGLVYLDEKALQFYMMGTARYMIRSWTYFLTEKKLLQISISLAMEKTITEALGIFTG